MEIDVITIKPTQLRDEIFKAVRKGTFETWETRTSEESEYLLTPVGAQFKDIVLLRFELNPFNDNLVIYPTHWRKTAKPSDALFAIVLGMITAALLTHFSTDFTKLETTR